MFVHSSVRPSILCQFTEYYEVLVDYNNLIGESFTNNRFEVIYNSEKLRPIENIIFLWHSPRL